MVSVLSSIEREKVSEVFKSLKYEDIDRLKELIEEDPDLVNARSSADRTPLHTAARRGFIEAVELLIDKGADLEAKDYREWTPLDWAIDQDQQDVVQLIKSKRSSA